MSLSHFVPTLQEGQRRKEIAAEDNTSKQQAKYKYEMKRGKQNTCRSDPSPKQRCYYITLQICKLITETDFS